MEDGVRQDAGAVPVPDRASWGGGRRGSPLRSTPGTRPRGHDTRVPTVPELSSPPSASPARSPHVCVRDTPPGPAFLSEEPLVSSCSDSQPQLSSCQTGFFKNIAVFTQHDELIGLQCVCAQARARVPWAALLALSPRASGIFGSRGCKAASPPRPAPSSAGPRRDGRASKAPLPSESRSHGK